MKQTLFGLALLATITFGFANNTNAQDNQGQNQRRAEMQARQRERLEKDLKLTDEQKPKFEEVYGRYQQELLSQIPQREISVDGETGASEHPRWHAPDQDLTT